MPDKSDKKPTQQNSNSKPKTTEERIKEVNDILHRGEPGNISVDAYSGYTGYKPQFVVDAMNAIFGVGGWGFEEVQSQVSENIIDERAVPILALTQVKVWLKGVDFMPIGWGQARITKGDLGDAKKGAQTDAIKKALSYFSIGNRAYHGLLSIK